MLKQPKHCSESMTALSKTLIGLTAKTETLLVTGALVSALLALGGCLELPA